MLPLSPILAAGQAKAQITEPAHRREPVPERRQPASDGEVPAPTPDHADGDLVFLISIPAPLPDIPVHVEQSPAVWHLAPTASRATGLDHCIFPQRLFIAAAGKIGR